MRDGACETVHARRCRYGRRAVEMLKRYRGVEDIVTLEFSEDLAVDAAQVASGVLLARLWARIPITHKPPSHCTGSAAPFRVWF
jgi:hypothetical protein